VKGENTKQLYCTHMKSILFSSSYDYYDFLISDLYSVNDVIVCNSPVKLTLKQRLMLRFILILERYFRRSKIIKKIYYKYLEVFNQIFPSIESHNFDVVYLMDNFLFFDDSRFHYWIKSISKSCKVVSINYNIINSGSNRIKSLYEKFDLNCSFDLNNCKQYGFYHFWGIYSKPIYTMNHENNTLFFLGLDKGRLHVIKSIYDASIKFGLTTDFIIINDNADEYSENGFIVQKNRVSYADSITRLNNAGCVLEIVTMGQNGLSLRAIEAIIFNKKLLTNNKAILSSPYFNPKFMRYFESLEDIDFDFISSDITVDYNYKGDFSPIKLLENIESQLFI